MVVTLPSESVFLTGGLLLALMRSASAPHSPIALHPFFWSRDTMCLLHQPAYTIVTTLSVSPSVTLLPSIITGCCPSCFCIWLAITPPPWTSTLRPSIAEKSWMNCSRSRGLSTTFPPIFMTFISAISEFISMSFRTTAKEAFL